MPRRSWLVLVAVAFAPVAQAQSGPSFACDPFPASTVEKLICRETPLAALDRMLADAYKAATAKAQGDAAATLTATQRGWIKGRNECWKDADVTACVTKNYRQRIAELQASFRLVAPVGSARYACPGAPPAEASADFFATEPPTVAVTYLGTTQVMFALPSGSGARYGGGNSQFWEHQGTAMIRWNAAKREVSCPKRSP